MYLSRTDKLIRELEPFQLNQQKGSTAQDLSFLKEASPIYVTSLSGNSVTTSSSTTTAHSVAGVNNDLIVADSSEYARTQSYQQQQVLRPPGSAQPVIITDDVNQNIVNKPVSKYNASAVNQNSSAVTSGAVNGGGPPNINNNSSSTLNNNNNSNISVSLNRAGAAVPCGGVNLNNIANRPVLDYTNYETNNNVTTTIIGESSEYHHQLANGHTSDHQVSQVGF